MRMNVALNHMRLPITTTSAFPYKHCNLGKDFEKVLCIYRTNPFQRCCFREEENTSKSTPHQGFSVLETDLPTDIGSVWSSLGFYVFSIHIPLSYGGLSVAVKLLNQSTLTPQTEAILILAIQVLELYIVLQLLKFQGKPQYDFSDFFRANKSSEQRNWLLAAVIGSGFLVSLVFVTSYFADRLIGPKDVNNNILKEILSSGTSSTISCIVVYCFVTPLLEEVVYRGFLITSLASSMKWQQAVLISSIVFSAVHLSADNFLQYVVIGIVLGCSYCWTGNLTTSLYFIGLLLLISSRAARSPSFGALQLALLHWSRICLCMLHLFLISHNYPDLIIQSCSKICKTARMSKQCRS